MERESEDASERGMTQSNTRVLTPGASPEKLVRASLLLLVSAMARLNCSRMLLSSDERCSVLCSATRRRSFKAWNSLWYAISFSGTKRAETGSRFDLARVDSSQFDGEDYVWPSFTALDFHNENKTKQDHKGK